MTTTQAIDYFGGVTSLARAIGIRRVAVYQWGEYPPVGRQYQLEVLTNGALRAEPEQCDQSSAGGEKAQDA